MTVVANLPRNASFLGTLAAELKKACGTGGTAAEDAVEIQGDHRERLRPLLAAKGYTVARLERRGRARADSLPTCSGVGRPLVDCTLRAERRLPPPMSSSESPAPPPPGWRTALERALPLLGHRNWIVIADSAYPAQSRSAIETVVSGADQLEVVEKVLAAVAASKHVRPIIYTDQELKFVREEDAAGISTYREQLAKLLEKREVNVMEHEKIISLLDQAGQTFRVLIVKTNMTLPYTSVFLQLDCGYWSADAEADLRARIDAAR